MFKDNNFLSFLKNKMIKNQNIVLISVVNTQYFSFRKAGAMMIVSDDKDIYGVISGGCFESDIIDCSIDVINNNKGKFVKHDLRVDQNAKDWSKGIGCNGIIELWLEPFLASDNWGGLKQAMDLLNIKTSYKESYFIRHIEHVNSFAIIQDSHITINNTNIENHLILKELKNEDAFLVKQNNLFFQKVQSPIKVLLLGGGPGSSSVINIAKELGWVTYVCEDRAKYSKHVENAQHLLDFETLDTLYFDAITIMSHSFEYDLKYLSYALSSKTKYIGLMGPKQRAKQILDKIEHKPSLERLHNPIGLDIGGESPSEISLSICAQIQSVLYDKD